MEQIGYFVPGDQGGEGDILARWRWPIPNGVTGTYVQAYTQPGECVLVPYCQGPDAVHEILAAGRRALALNFDPALILAVQVALALPPERELDAAVARLGDSLKQGVPLRRYLSGFYATTCPACLRPAVADYFVWDREQDEPVAKGLRCPACAWDGRAAADHDDRERLTEVPARAMHYHYVLDRVAPRSQPDAFRSRLERLLELYSARNLYALAELTLKIEGLFPGGPLQQALKILLLDCLERCCSLELLPGSTARRRGLQRPGRYLERNVWHAFEEAVTRLRTWAGAQVADLASSLDQFRKPDGEGTSYVGQGLVRDLPRLVAPRSTRLILSSPPPLDSAVWSLSYLWGAWLLGTEAVASLRPLLRQRTPDPEWYARVMAGSFGTLADLLCDEGRLVLVLTDQRPTVVEALVLAAAGARLGVVSLVQCGADYRLELAPSFPQAVAIPAQDLPVQVRETALAAIVETIRQRGEPVARRPLHAAVQQRLAEAGLLSRALDEEAEGPSPLAMVAGAIESALDAPVLVRLPEGEAGELWWLADAAGATLAAPLCDRVEAAAYQVLQEALALTEIDFSRAVYARFPGTLTPDADLVALCLRTYGQELTPGYWQLRAEDLPAARRTEGRTIVEHLLALGRRLGYRATPWEPFEVAWFEGEAVRAAFAVRWQAAVSEVLALGVRLGAAQPYLVIPGGRAALASHKLAHNPLWERAVDEAGWRFVKYRHVRQLVSQPEVDEYVLQTIVGLDPIVEQETAQLPLF